MTEFAEKRLSHLISACISNPLVTTPSEIKKAYNQLIKSTFANPENSEITFARVIDLLEDFRSQLRIESGENPYKAQRKQVLLQTLVDYFELALQSVQPENLKSDLKLRAVSLKSGAAAERLSFLLLQCFRLHESIEITNSFLKLKLLNSSSKFVEEQKSMILSRIAALSKILKNSGETTPPRKMLKRMFLGWVARSNPEFAQECVDKMVCTQRIKKEIAIFRLRKVSRPERHESKMKDFCKKIMLCLNRAIARQSQLFQSFAFFAMKIKLASAKKNHAEKLSRKLLGAIDQKLKEKGDQVIEILTSDSPKQFLAERLVLSSVSKTRSVFSKLMVNAFRQNFIHTAKFSKVIASKLSKMTHEMTLNLSNPRTDFIEKISEGNSKKLTLALKALLNFNKEKEIEDRYENQRLSSIREREELNLVDQIAIRKEKTIYKLEQKFIAKLLRSYFILRSHGKNRIFSLSILSKIINRANSRLFAETIIQFQKVIAHQEALINKRKTVLQGLLSSAKQKSNFIFGSLRNMNTEKKNDSKQALKSLISNLTKLKADAFYFLKRSTERQSLLPQEEGRTSIRSSVQSAQYNSIRLALQKTKNEDSQFKDVERRLEELQRSENALETEIQNVNKSLRQLADASSKKKIQLAEYSKEHDKLSDSLDTKIKISGEMANHLSANAERENKLKNILKEEEAIRSERELILRENINLHSQEKSIVDSEPEVIERLSLAESKRNELQAESESLTKTLRHLDEEQKKLSIESPEVDASKRRKSLIQDDMHKITSKKLVITNVLIQNENENLNKAEEIMKANEELKQLEQEKEYITEKLSLNKLNLFNIESKIKKLASEKDLLKSEIGESQKKIAELEEQAKSLKEVGIPSTSDEQKKKILNELSEIESQEAKMKISLFEKETRITQLKYLIDGERQKKESLSGNSERLSIDLSSGSRMSTAQVRLFKTFLLSVEMTRLGSVLTDSNFNNSNSVDPEIVKSMIDRINNLMNQIEDDKKQIKEAEATIEELKLSSARVIIPDPNTMNGDLSNGGGNVFPTALLDPTPEHILTLPTVSAKPIKRKTILGSQADASIQTDLPAQIVNIQNFLKKFTNSKASIARNYTLINRNISGTERSSFNITTNSIRTYRKPSIVPPPRAHTPVPTTQALWTGRKKAPPVLSRSPMKERLLISEPTMFLRNEKIAEVIPTPSVAPPMSSKMIGQGHNSQLIEVLHGLFLKKKGVEYNHFKLISHMIMTKMYMNALFRWKLANLHGKTGTKIENIKRILYGLLKVDAVIKRRNYGLALNSLHIHAAAQRQFEVHRILYAATRIMTSKWSEIILNKFSFWSKLREDNKWFQIIVRNIMTRTSVEPQIALWRMKMHRPIRRPQKDLSKAFEALDGIVSQIQINNYIKVFLMLQTLIPRRDRSILFSQISVPQTIVPNNANGTRLFVILFKKKISFFFNKLKTNAALWKFKSMRSVSESSNYASHAQDELGDQNDNLVDREALLVLLKENNACKELIEQKDHQLTEAADKMKDLQSSMNVLKAHLFYAYIAKIEGLMVEKKKQAIKHFLSHSRV